MTILFQFSKTIKNLISNLESERETVRNWFKGTVMQIEKALKNDRLYLSKIPGKFCVSTIYSFS